jgi:hypothetical protein
MHACLIIFINGVSINVAFLIYVNVVQLNYDSTSYIFHVYLLANTHLIGALNLFMIKMILHACLCIDVHPPSLKSLLLNYIHWWL